jgi:NAD+ kinase
MTAPSDPNRPAVTDPIADATSNIASPEPRVPTPISRVGIVAKMGLHEAAHLFDDIADWLTAKGVTCIFETQTATLSARYKAGNRDYEATARSAEDLPRFVDLILLLGGDGTLIGTADRIAMAGAGVPILGVNFGSLGFLTEITLPELYSALDAAISGKASIEDRLMLRAEIVRNGDVLNDVRVLNEVVVTRGALSRMSDLAVSVNGQFVARFKADGIIVATATGSTAYNLSAGGPIVHPGVDALVLTPIAPHALSNRPVVIPAANATLVIQSLPSPLQHDVFVTFDGQSGFPLSPDHSVRITRAELPLRLVRATTRSYFEVLRQKLKWAERA